MSNFIYCPQCGAKSDSLSGANFCTKCGQKLNSLSSQARRPATTQPEPEEASLDGALDIQELAKKLKISVQPFASNVVTVGQVINESKGHTFSQLPPRPRPNLPDSPEAIRKAIQAECSSSRQTSKEEGE